MENQSNNFELFLAKVRRNNGTYVITIPVIAAEMSALQEGDKLKVWFKKLEK